MEIKDYNVVINGRNVFDPPIKIDLEKYDNIRKIAICQSDDYTTGCLLDYTSFKKYYKLIFLFVVVVVIVVVVFCVSLSSTIFIISDANYRHLLLP